MQNDSSHLIGIIGEYRVPDHSLGLPVLRALSLCTCRRHYPGAAAGCLPRSSHPAVTAFPGRGRRVGLHIDLFEACSAFTRIAACTLALSPNRDTLIEGFSHFVTSMTAPIASGWSESPGGACTHWKAPPCHGAPPYPPFASVGVAPALDQKSRPSCDSQQAPKREEVDRVGPVDKLVADKRDALIRRRAPTALPVR